MRTLTKRMMPFASGGTCAGVGAAVRTLFLDNVVGGGGGGGG